MRSGSKQVYYQSWQQLSQAVKELAGEPHRFNNQLKSIITSAFGSETHRGLISDKIGYYYHKTPIYWAEEIDRIVKLFSPEGELLSGSTGILTNADNQYSINPKLLPKSVINEFPPRGDKISSMLKSLKRERGQQFFVNSWEWFCIHVAHALVNLPEVEQNRTLVEQQRQDEMFYIFSRNPLLLIIRKALQPEYCRRKHGNLQDRARAVFELFIIEDLLSSTRSSARSEVRYQLRSHHIALMFLLVNSRRSNMSGETLLTYHQYFQKTSQNFAQLSTSGNNSLNLRNFIRTWTFFVTREHGHDYTVVRQLQNCNPSRGCYRLERCPLERWVQAAKATDILSKQILPITATRNNIYRLLKKHSEWTPSFSFLYVLEQFVQFDRIRLANYIKRSLRKEEDQTLNRCFQRTLIHLTEFGAETHQLEIIEKRLNDKFEGVWQKKINVNFAERSQQAKQKLSKTSRQQSKSMSYQNPRVRNVWQHPKQQNEFQILLRGSLWVASKLDKLIPGHSKRTYPWVNLRIFANPLVFMAFFIVFALIVRSYLK